MYFYSWPLAGFVHFSWVGGPFRAGLVRSYGNEIDNMKFRSPHSLLPGLITLLFILVAPSWADEKSGEAKKSSENAMQKADDGKPVLTGNMLQHMMKAQMYQAQQNMPAAMQEQMKAQMLQQQLQKNNDSRDKNEERRDTAVFTSDAAQKQMQGSIMGGGLFKSERPKSESSGRTFLDPAPKSTTETSAPAASAQEQINTELIVFDEGVNKAAEAPSTAETPAEALQALAPTSNNAPIAEKPIEVSKEIVAELTKELGHTEAQFTAVAAAAWVGSEGGKGASLMDAGPPPLVVKKVASKKNKKDDKDEFWKTPAKKKTAKKNSRRAKRALASQKSVSNR